MLKKIIGFLNRVLLTALLIACAGPGTSPLAATEQTDDPAAENKIHVRADKLVSQRNSNYILFTGNVDVEMGTTRIRSSELKVFYKQAPAADAPAAESNIDKIVARKDVRIDMENREATCEKAVYRADVRRLVLTGEAVVIRSENNSITGRKITFNQESGEIIVDGEGGQRVNAIIHQGDGNILEPQTEEKNP